MTGRSCPPPPPADQASSDADDILGSLSLTPEGTWSVPFPYERTTLTQVRRETVAEQSLSILRTRIIGGELRPGDAVTEEAVAKGIGISRPTMREVLNSLVGEGLLTRHPTTRVLQVTMLDDQHIKEIYNARRLLELGGVEAAGTASDTELASLEATVAEMAIAVAEDDTYALVQADSRCHSQTVGFMHSRYLDDLHAQLMAKLHLRLAQVEATEARHSDAVLRQHEEFVRLILDRDTAGAQANLKERLDAAEVLVLQGPEHPVPPEVPPGSAGLHSRGGSPA